MAANRRKNLFFMLMLLLSLAVAGEETWRLRIDVGQTAFTIAADGTERKNCAPEAFRGEPSPDGTRFVRTINGEIHLADADGKNDKLLTRPDGKHASFRNNPAWSPDGKSIACDESLEGLPRAMLVDVASGKARRILADDRPGYKPRFAPDGRIAFLSRDFRKGKHTQLCLVDANKPGKPKVLAEADPITDFAWSPDGKSIAWGEPGALKVLNLASGKTRQVLFPDIEAGFARAAPHAFYGAQHLLWRPDGKAIACMIYSHGPREMGPNRKPLPGDGMLFLIGLDDGKAASVQTGTDFPAFRWVAPE